MQDREIGNEIDVVDCFRWLGGHVKKENGDHLTGYCPICEDPDESKSPSFWMATTKSPLHPAGMWKCLGKCGEKATGPIEKLYVSVIGGTIRDAIASIADHYGIEGFGVSMVKTKKTRDIPSRKLCEAWHDMLLKDEEAIEYWTVKRAVSLEVLHSALIGVNGKNTTIPILNKAGVPTNLRTKPFRAADLEKGRTKTMGLKDVKCGVYPLNLFDESREAVICEGEPDALALHSIGVNAITHTGGSGSLTRKNFSNVVPDGQKGGITIVTDNDDAGEKAGKKLRRDYLEAGMDMVRMIQLPKEVNDIEQYLRGIPPENRKKAWLDLLDGAKRCMKEDFLGHGVWVEDGTLVDADGDEIAPFTGELISWGKIRYGQEDGLETTYKFRLIAFTGAVAEVEHIVGDKSFHVNVTSQAGPRFSFPAKHSDTIFHVLCSISAEDALERDSGFLFGYEGSDRDTFWAPEISYFKGQAFETAGEIDMKAPVGFLKHMRLAPPGNQEAAEGFRVLLANLYRSHKPSVMGPMIASAMLAPIRRLLFPNDQAFNVLIYGRSGCGKTSRARVVQNLFSGKIVDDQQLETWQNSTKSIELLMSMAGDSWLLLDELRLANKKGKERTDTISLLQGISQGGGRMTLTQNRTFRDSPVANCVLASTMEALPGDDDSMLARSVLINVPTIDLLDHTYKGPHDVAVKNQDKLPHALSTWISWCMSDGEGFDVSCADTLDSAVDWSNKLCVDVADTMFCGWRSTPNAPRIYQRAILLSTVWNMIIELGMGLGAINQGEATAFLDEWMLDALPTYFGHSFREVQNAGAQEDIVSTISMALESGDAYFGWQSTLNGPLDMTRRPPNRKEQAMMIGVIYPSVELRGYDGVEDEGINYKGQCLNLMMKSPVETLTEGMRWRQIKATLKDYKMVMQTDAKTARDRGIWMSKSGNSQILEPYLDLLPD